jgi:hypothetical protein
MKADVGDSARFRRFGVNPGSFPVQEGDRVPPHAAYAGRWAFVLQIRFGTDCIISEK